MVTSTTRPLNALYLLRGLGITQTTIAAASGSHQSHVSVLLHGGKRDRKIEQAIRDALPAFSDEMLFSEDRLNVPITEAVATESMSYKIERASQ